MSVDIHVASKDEGENIKTSSFQPTLWLMKATVSVESSGFGLCFHLGLMWISTYMSQVDAIILFFPF